MRTTFTPILLLLLAAAPAAQTMRVHVSPAGFAAREGAGNNSWPFSRTHLTFSYMQVHDDLPALPMLIRKIAFRRDGQVPLATYPAYSITATVRLSTALYPSTTARAGFQANHGKDLAEPLTRTTLKFPAAPAPVTPPAAFLQVIDLGSKPFAYKGRQAGSLVWEIRIHNHSLQQAAPDDAAALVPSSYRKIGMGGLAPGQTRTADHYSILEPAPGMGTRLRLHCFADRLPANQPYLWMLGVDDQRFASLALPIDLEPLGAKGNHLYIAPITMLNGTTGPTGGIDTSQGGYLGFDPTPALAGLSLLTQVMASNPANKALPLMMTNYCHTTMPLPVSGCRIFAPGSDTAVSGTVDRQSVLVTAFTWQ